MHGHHGGRHGLDGNGCPGEVADTQHNPMNEWQVGPIWEREATLPYPRQFAPELLDV